MSILMYLSDLMIPLLIFCIVGIGILKKKDVYGDFIKGAKDGMKVVVDIMPTLVGLMVGVVVLRSSVLLDFLAQKLNYITK